eukprot:CAMPEP_0171080736 /NCGR_PEP_ID=MMETSP0766_2-20121228/16051_1 /TAXON_ID=439317 /ORGANISM="Gambierdiscus australes, Strain CAWD 149" /LENGTH=72 /DNA_ID=CAMNT_0011538003 /DNA_START=206 /DNA_END=424 /DNA_ORIENTATION=+
MISMCLMHASTIVASASAPETAVAWVVLAVSCASATKAGCKDHHAAKPMVSTQSLPSVGKAYTVLDGFCELK